MHPLPPDKICITQPIEFSRTQIKSKPTPSIILLGHVLKVVMWNKRTIQGVIYLQESHLDKFKLTS